MQPTRLFSYLAQPCEISFDSRLDVPPRHKILPRKNSLVAWHQAPRNRRIAPVEVEGYSETAAEEAKF